jgi:hypothetical protein
MNKQIFSLLVLLPCIVTGMNNEKNLKSFKYTGPENLVCSLNPGVEYSVPAEKLKKLECMSQQIGDQLVCKATTTLFSDAMDMYMNYSQNEEPSINKLLKLKLKYLKHDRATLEDNIKSHGLDSLDLNVERFKKLSTQSNDEEFADAFVHSIDIEGFEGILKAKQKNIREVMAVQLLQNLIKLCKLQDSVDEVEKVMEPIKEMRSKFFHNK